MQPVNVAPEKTEGPSVGIEEAESEQHSSAPQTHITALKTLIKNVFLPFLAVRVCLVLIGVITIYYIGPLVNPKLSIYQGGNYRQLPFMLYLMWVHFDSGFYLTIASGGYWAANTLHSGSNWGFFPFYPLLMHLLGAPVHTFWEGYMVVGLIISNIAALVAIYYLYKLTEKEFNSSIASRAVFLLGLFPMSFYLSAVYPESLFLAFTIGSVYYARQGRWWLAGILGACATLTRVSGITLVIVLAWEYWQVLAEQYAPLVKTVGGGAYLRAWVRSRFIGILHAFAVWRTWSGILALALIPASLGLFMLYSKWKVGAWKAYFIAQQYGWNHHFGNPLLLVWSLLKHPEAASPYNWNFYALNMVCTFLFVLMLIPIFRKLPALYGILALAFLIIPLTTGKMDSVARYDLTIFPVYMLLAWWTTLGTVEQQARRYSMLCVIFAMLLSLGMVLFTLNVYAIA